MSTTKKPLLIRSSRSSVISQMPVGPGTVISEILRITLYWTCPFQGASEFSQQFIETLRARGSSLPPWRDLLLSAGQRQTASIWWNGQRWLFIRNTVLVLSGTG